MIKSSFASFINSFVANVPSGVETTHPLQKDVGRLLKPLQHSPDFQGELTATPRPQTKEVPAPADTLTLFGVPSRDPA